MTRSRCLRSIVTAVVAVPTLASAQDIKPVAAPNKVYAAITGPIAKILSGDMAFATTDYVQQFYRDPASRGFDAELD